MIMTDTQQLSVNEMFRQSIGNNADFLTHVANYIDSLEHTIEVLRKEVVDLQSLNDNDIDDGK